MSGKVSKFAAVFEARQRMEAEENAAQSQLSESSQLTPSSQIPESSQLSEPAPGSSESSQLPQSSQLTVSPLNLLAALPEVKGHMETPYQILDHLCRHLTPFEQAGYLQLCRLSWGFRQTKCRISHPKLAERANMSLAQVKRVIKNLVTKGLIEKTGQVQGYGKDQGVEYLVHAPSWQVQRSSQLRQSSQLPGSSQLSGSHNKERNKEFIKRDASACPDCYGTGFWYPQGTAHGVVRCQHPKLEGK